MSLALIKYPIVLELSVKLLCNGALCKNVFCVIGKPVNRTVLLCFNIHFEPHYPLQFQANKMIPSTLFTWKFPVAGFVLFGEPSFEFWVTLAGDTEQLQSPYTTLSWHQLIIAFGVSISNAVWKMTAFSPA